MISSRGCNIGMPEDVQGKREVVPANQIFSIWNLYSDQVCYKIRYRLTS
jgi:hypothetical protein